VLTRVFAVFLSEAHPSVTDGPPQGVGRSALIDVDELYALEK
jgi:hypothetical protein